MGLQVTIIGTNSKTPYETGFDFGSPRTAIKLADWAMKLDSRQYGLVKRLFINGFCENSEELMLELDAAMRLYPIVDRDARNALAHFKKEMGEGRDYEDVLIEE